MARTKLKTSSRNQGGTLPPDNGERTRLIEENYTQIIEEAKRRKQDRAKVLGKKIRKQVEKARQARVEREARMDHCERYLRSWQDPPKNLLDEWVEWCVAEEIDPTERLDYLRRPLKNRLDELIGERPKGWDVGLKPPKDRVLYQFYCWKAFDDPKQNSLSAELLTYLEDVQEEFWQRQVRRSRWRVAEWERAEVVVAALLAVLKEFRLYFMESTGVEPESDPRLASVLTLLLKAEKRLKAHQKPPIPRSDPERRPTVGPEKNWAAKVQGEVFRRLNMIRPWRKHVDDSQMEHIRMLRRTSERIVERLGIRVSRGIGSAKPQRPKPPSNPGDDIARRICHALGVRRLTRTRR